MTKNPVLIEFNKYKCPRTSSTKLQLIDKNFNTLATLDMRDFEMMIKQGKDPLNKTHIVEYCNWLKNTNIPVDNFKSVTFPIPVK